MRSTGLASANSPALICTRHRPQAPVPLHPERTRKAVQSNISRKYWPAENSIWRSPSPVLIVIVGKKLPRYINSPQTCRNHLTAETFDNSKNPVACFEGPGSIFRGHREKQTDKSETSRNVVFSFNFSSNGFSLCVLTKDRTPNLSGFTPVWYVKRESERSEGSSASLQ
jgi:hypothetical protein